MKGHGLGLSGFEPERSCVYLVGAGPGDPGLLTVKALALMQGVDVVVYDRLVSQEILALIPAGVSKVFAGKQSGSHPMPQQDINQLLERLARSGHSVVRLKGGDPCVFGRGGEEALHLAQKGIRFEIVPGVTAATACSAYAGIPLTHREYAHGVLFLSGHCKKGGDLGQQIARNYQANSSITLVIYMGLGNLQSIVDALFESGADARVPVAFIEDGTTKQQRRILTNLGAALVEARKHALRAPVLIVVGEVVSLALDLDWFPENFTQQAGRACG